MKWFYFGLNNRYCGIIIENPDGIDSYQVPIEFAVAFELWAMNQRKQYKRLAPTESNTDKFNRYIIWDSV